MTLSTKNLFALWLVPALTMGSIALIATTPFSAVVPSGNARFLLVAKYYSRNLPEVLLLLSTPILLFSLQLSEVVRSWVLQGASTILNTAFAILQWLWLWEMTRWQRVFSFPVLLNEWLFSYVALGFVIFLAVLYVMALFSNPEKDKTLAATSRKSGRRYAFLCQTVLAVTYLLLVGVAGWWWLPLAEPNECNWSQNVHLAYGLLAAVTPIFLLIGLIFDVKWPIYWRGNPVPGIAAAVRADVVIIGMFLAHGPYWRHFAACASTTTTGLLQMLWELFKVSPWLFIGCGLFLVAWIVSAAPSGHVKRQFGIAALFLAIVAAPWAIGWYLGKHFIGQGSADFVFFRWAIVELNASESVGLVPVEELCAHTCRSQPREAASHDAQVSLLRFEQGNWLLYAADGGAGGSFVLARLESEYICKQGIICLAPDSQIRTISLISFPGISKVLIVDKSWVQNPSREKQTRCCWPWIKAITHPGAFPPFFPLNLIEAKTLRIARVGGQGGIAEVTVPGPLGMRKNVLISLRPPLGSAL